MDTSKADTILSIAVLNGHTAEWTSEKKTALFCKGCNTVWILDMSRDISPVAHYTRPCKKAWEVPW